MVDGSLRGWQAQGGGGIIGHSFQQGECGRARVSTFPSHALAFAFASTAKPRASFAYPVALCRI